MPTATVVMGEAPADCEAIVNINKAGVEELETLHGIGEVLSQRIVDYRIANGPFETIDALDEVKGIGEKTLENIRLCIVLQ